MHACKHTYTHTCKNRFLKASKLHTFCISCKVFSVESHTSTLYPKKKRSDDRYHKKWPMHFSLTRSASHHATLDSHFPFLASSLSSEKNWIGLSRLPDMHMNQTPNKQQSSLMPAQGLNHVTLTHMCVCGIQDSDSERRPRVVRFRDDFVKPGSPEMVSPYEQPVDDGSGPGERDRVHALGFTNANQVWGGMCGSSCVTVTFGTCVCHIGHDETDRVRVCMYVCVCACVH
jgi:hypothetical protein